MQSIFQKIWRGIKDPFQQGFSSLCYQGFHFAHSLLLPEGVAKDACLLKAGYRKSMRRNLSLENPQKFTEKIQWLKLYDRNPLHTMKADKYAVREFVKNTIGEQHLVELFGVYDRPEEIDFDALPDRFVLKSTHGCGMSIVCPDKNQLDRKAVVKKFNRWLKINWYYKSKRQWAYKDIPPRIICEEFLESNTDWGLLDYKFFCLNGKPEYIQVIFDRTGREERFQNLYDTQWNRLSVTTSGFPINPKNVPPPPCLDEMLRLASALAKDIIFSRVDFYYHNDKIIFGEITFYPAGGVNRFNPVEFDDELGRKLKLPFELNIRNNAKSGEQT